MNVCGLIFWKCGDLVKFMEDIGRFIEDIVSSNVRIKIF